MPRKKKAVAEEPKAEVTPEFVVPEPEIEVKAEVSFGKCKACSFELKRILYDSRAKESVYLYVCDNGGCPLYRQPQKYEGDLPRGVNIAIA